MSRLTTDDTHSVSISFLKKAGSMEYHCCAYNQVIAWSYNRYKKGSVGYELCLTDKQRYISFSIR